VTTVQQKPITKQRIKTGDKNVLRAAVLGINDGLCSNFNFVMCLAATGMLSKSILQSALAAIISGAFSMGGGELNSMLTAGYKKASIFKATIYSFLMFMVGALIPVIPFFFYPDVINAITISAIICAFSLIIIGFVDTPNNNKKKSIISGIRHIIVGASIAAVTYGIGCLLGTQMN
jgi:VIT1/CCC1 family predicted Fe2+/Mn2+ transporter